MELTAAPMEDEREEGEERSGDWVGFSTGPGRRQDPWAGRDEGDHQGAVLGDGGRARGGRGRQPAFEEVVISGDTSCVSETVLLLVYAAHVCEELSSAARGITTGIRFIVLGGGDCATSPSSRNVIRRGGITAPSVQTCLVLEAMAETNHSDETRWDKMFAALDSILMHRSGFALVRIAQFSLLRVYNCRNHPLT